MASVDSKVVSLEFNNSRFAGAVKDTMNALDKLKEKLSFKGGTKAFEDIQASANKVQMNNISRGIEGVSKGFIAMSTVAVTALSRITDKALSVGTTLATSITTKPITDGFSEYETKMGSFQTIMSNTQAEMEKSGMTAEQWQGKVTKALSDLNTYSDKTIYNFGEMTKNIGTFTAAGVDLQTSVSAIKGIANIAAISGSSSEQASTAMYQLSQAMASGTVKLMDWNSVVNAGMGGEVFQKALFDTGKALGTLKDVPMSQTFDDWKKSGNSFRESLKDEWLTTDVLTTTLGAASGELSRLDLLAKGFTQSQADAMLKLGENGVEAATKVKTASQLVSTLGEALGSGWATSLELIIGNFNEAKKLFTNLSNYFGGMISASANARNLILMDWKNRGGRDTLMQGFLYAWEDILSILRPVGQAFRDVFPKKSSDDLLAMTRNFRDLFKNFKMGEGTISAIKSSFTVFFKVIKGVFTFVGFLAKVFFKLAGAIGAFASSLVNAAGGALGRFFEALVRLKNAIFGGEGPGGAITGALDGISSAAGKLGTFLGNLFSNLDKVTAKIIEFANNLQNSKSSTDEAGKSTSRFAGVIEWFKNVFSGIGNFFSKLFGGISSFGQAIRDVLSGIGDALGNIGSSLSNAFQNINWNTIIGGVGVGAGVMLVKRIRDFLDTVDIGDFLDTIKTKLSNVLDSISGALNSFSLSLKADALKKVAISIGILALSLLLLASIKPEKLLTATAAIGALFVALNKSMKQLGAIGSDMTKIAGTMVGLALAMLLLSKAVEVMGSMKDNGDISAGVGAVSALMAGIVIATKEIKKNAGDLAKSGLAMIGMAAAIYILTFAIQRLTKLDPMKALLGVVAVSGAMAAMGAALKLVDEKQAPQKGLAFTLIALGLNIFAKAVETFGKMKWQVLVQGMAAIGAALGGMLLFFKLLPPDMILIATEILIISIAMNVLAKAVEAMGSMKWDTMKQGLEGIAASLLIFAAAAQIMNSAIVGAGAIVIMAVGLTLLAGAVATFGQMGVDTMIKSILGIAAVLLVIAAAGALMGSISPLLLAGGLAFMVLGAGMLLFGAGAWLAASAIIALTGASGAGVIAAIAALKALAGAIPAFITAFAKGFIDGFKLILDEIPGLMKSASKALYSVLTMLIDLVAKVIHNNISKVVQAGMDLILGLLRGIRDNVGKVINAAVEVLLAYINGLADAIDKHAEEIGNAGRHLALSLIKGIVKALVPKPILDKIGDMVKAMVDWFKEKLGIHSPSSVFKDLAGNILDGLKNGLTEKVPKVLEFFVTLPFKILEKLGDLTKKLVPKGLELLGGLITGLFQKFVELEKWWLSLPFKIIGFLVNAATTLIPKGLEFLGGLLSGFIQKLPEIGDWLKRLPGRVLGFIGNVGSKLLQKGRDLLQGMKDGLVEKFGQITTWAGKLIGRLITAIGSVNRKMWRVGMDIFQGLWDGLSEKFKALADWFGKKIQWFVDTAKKIPGVSSPSKVFRAIGGYYIEGLKIGMSDRWRGLHAETEANTNKLVASVKNAIASSGIETLDGINPTIKPVLDLSLVEEKARTLGDILGIDSLATDMSYINAQHIATTADGAGSTADQVGGGDTYLNFVQNNNSPKALSTGDIYRGHKSQIALAKKELGLAS